MSTKKRRSNVVTKALLITALASGIAGMQATHAASKDIGGNSLNYFTDSGNIYSPYNLTDICSSSTAKDAKKIDLSKNFSYIPGIYTYSTSTTTLPGIIYYAEDHNVTDSYGNIVDTFKGGVIYLTQDDKYAILGDAKSILGGSSSSGLSEEQKTMIKDLIANWPGLCRLVEKFFKRNDDNNEYDKKT